MAEVAPVHGSQPLIIDLNEPQAPMDERRFSTPARIEGPHTDAREDKMGAEGAFPSVRKTYWRSASWTPGRGGRSSLQRTASGKATGLQRANGKVLPEDAGGGKGKGLRIQVDNGWKGDVEVIKLSGGEDSGPTTGGGSQKPGSRPPRGMHLDLGALQMGNPVAEPTEIQARRTKFAYFEKHCSRVAEHVYLGSDVVARSREILRESGITHVLNCVGFVCPEYFAGELVYKTLWLQDIPGEDLVSILYDIFDYLEDVRTQHGRVLVHCCQGVSRSTSLVIAYLMWRDNRSFDETFRDVKAVRGTANPNMGFACQLLQWQKRITWGPDGEPPPHSGRMYRVAPHSTYSPLHLVPKPVGKLRGSELDRRGVFVVDASSGQVFVWVGQGAPHSMAEAGGRIAAQLVRYERAKGPVTVVRQGQEGAEFWAVMSAGGGDEASEERGQELDAGKVQRRESRPVEVDRDEGGSEGDTSTANPGANPDGPVEVGTLPAYDADYELFRRAESGEIKMATPGSSVLPGATKPMSPTKIAKEDQKQSGVSGAPSPRGEPILRTAVRTEDPSTAPDQSSKARRDQPGGNGQTAPETKLTSPPNRKQAQPDVFVPSVSRSYPVSTLPPPSPSLPPPNKRSKSPTTTETAAQSADVLSPPPPSPSSSMGSFYKQHRVLSPRPGLDLSEPKPRKSPSNLGPRADSSGGDAATPRRRSLLSEEKAGAAEATRSMEWGLAKDAGKESGGQTPRQMWPPVSEVRQAHSSFAISPNFGGSERAWTVPESPRVVRRTSFPGFAVSGSQHPESPGMRPARNEEARPALPGGVATPESDPKDENEQEAERSVDERRESAASGEEGKGEPNPREETQSSELGESRASDGSESRGADSWAKRRPGLQIPGVESVKVDVAPVSPVGLLPGAEVLSPGVSEETDDLVTERIPPTAKKLELLAGGGELVESRDSPMDVDRRQFRERGRATPVNRARGEEKAEVEGGPRLFEAPLFEEVEMFDTDDLHSESAYVLLVNSDGASDGGKGRDMFVWLGADYLKQGDDRRISTGSAMSTDSTAEEEEFKDGGSIGEDFVRRNGLPSETPFVVVTEGKEPDEFWSHFVNG
ncbi:Dual specificity phosphatase [Klebsormidium nitens]|uniref:Dual specificity phosphatase n=1 Tax=Klebsormidium nitens TaxID=105231 RepID=A0A1Y1HIX4_KLENI|nr:Dual specificity phosphatase [Klebsormidium nitens]|eukprot:GAQ77843.1 Dual specificity phosphatase [Klebsormidium nitens]